MATYQLIGVSQHPHSTLQGTKEKHTTTGNCPILFMWSCPGQKLGQSDRGKMKGAGFDTAPQIHARHAATQQYWHLLQLPKGS